MFNISGEERCAMEIEARQEMAWEAQEKRIKDLMQDHEMFADFVRDSDGEEYISDFIGDLLDRRTEMARAYREYCETFMKERG